MEKYKVIFMKNKIYIILISILISILLNLLLFVIINIFIVFTTKIPLDAKISIYDFLHLIKFVFFKLITSLMVIILFSAFLGIMIGILVFININKMINLFYSIVIALLAGLLWGLSSSILLWYKIDCGLVIYGIVYSLLITIFLRNIIVKKIID